MGALAWGRIAFGGVASYTTRICRLAPIRLPLSTKVTVLSHQHIKCVSQVAGSGTFIDSSITWMASPDITKFMCQRFSRRIRPCCSCCMERNPRFHGFRPYAGHYPQLGWQNLAELKGFILVKPASTYNANSHSGTGTRISWMHRLLRRCGNLYHATRNRVS